MIKAVIFDMDGVIVDTEPLHKKAYFKMFQTVNIMVSDQLYESFTGQSTIAICRILCKHFNLQETPQKLVSLKRMYFKDLFENDSDLALIDGVEVLIKDYYNNGLTLVLASSASMPTINNIFDRFNLNIYFTTKLSGADLKASKPHPEIFEKAAISSGFAKEQCFVLEDSTNGIEAAKAAKIYCIAFKSPNSKNQDYRNASKVVSDFDDISFDKLSTLFQD